ncbi:uncharacterized protein [Chelonus insularis]|uniref:uncharacterized protein isoform X2 n=1 Tax=Chelonus insularis TaxID=460826 RepID=UPI00158EF3BB|nr:uncharacterized protein LOC118065336 isoform X2 [Chelonus insularis]
MMSISVYRRRVKICIHYKRKRTVGQVQGEKIDRAIPPISSGHKLKSKKKSKRTDQHHPNYLETLEKDFSTDYPVYLDHLPEYYPRSSRCTCQGNNQNLFYNVCHCQRRLPVKLLYCSGVSPSRSSIKSRSSNEKKIIDADKKVKNPEVTGPKCFCSTRVTPKKNLLGSSQAKKDADMRDNEKVKKYVEIVKIKSDSKTPEKQINNSKLKIKSSKSLELLSRKSTQSSALKSLPKKEIQTKEKANSSKSSQFSLTNRKNSEKPKTSDKISLDTKKSSSPRIKSSIMKDSTKSPKVLKEIKPQLSDESEESIVESYSEAESTVEENSTHSNREVDTEKSESKHSSISNRDGNEEKDSNGDESVEEIDNVNENVDIQLNS